MRLQKLLLVCVLPFLILSCELESMVPALSMQGDSGYTYSESRSLWLQMKRDNGNSYEYSIDVTSWTGNGNTTTIIIQDGEAVGRIYQEYFMDPDTGIKNNGFGYSETGVDVGTHEAGAKPMTMDEIYGACLAEYLIADPENNTIYFDTDDVGLMILCGFVPDQCADDCFEGFMLSGFKWH